MNGIYLASKEHRLPNYQMDYNDIENYPGITVPGDMMAIDINKYDYVIATPPCNYYSRANYRRETSKIAQETKHLLPAILEKLKDYKKPFIVENVCNSTLLPKTNFIEFEFGNHHFYTNTLLLFTALPQAQNTAKRSYGHRDGNYNVDLIIKIFLETIGA